MTIEKLGYNYFHIYDVVCDHLVSHTYMYYNKRTAVRMFKAEYHYNERKRIERYFKQLRYQR